ncbi:MAG TPA: dihydroorotate dehydrogenase electron transfer subunit [Mycobacteriales bacterium]|nr:dihydroorotate dehydrogenase electron transfer subunit [Mycobacteriales bacterium]
MQWVGEMLSNRRVGAYHLITVAAPELAQRLRPGQFVAVAVGGPFSTMLPRRCFAIYSTTPQGLYAGTAQFVVDVTGPGTRWLADLRPRDRVDLIGPLGTPFLLSDEPMRTVLVGGGHSGAGLLPLADALHARDCSVEFVLGASTADRIFGVLEAKRTGASVTVTTEDASAGVEGTVADVLEQVLAGSGADAMYASGSRNMLRAVSAVASAYHVPCQVAVEEPMACGVGLCATCVLPVAGDDGVTRMLRSCVDGPVFFANRVRWDAAGGIPADCLGAEATGVG